mgnify:FL=1
MPLETTVTKTTILLSLPACRPRFFPATRSALLYVPNYNPFLTCRCFKNGQEQMRYECSKLGSQQNSGKEKETHLCCCGRGLHTLAQYLLNMLIKPGRSVNTKGSGRSLEQPFCIEACCTSYLHRRVSEGPSFRATAVLVLSLIRQQKSGEQRPKYLGRKTS